MVQEFREAQVKLDSTQVAQQSSWKAPSPGVMKVNFDGAKIGDNGYGLGVIVRDCFGSVVTTGVLQGLNFQRVEYVEAQACYWAMKMALEHKHFCVSMEGDCLSLISKLKRRECPNIELGILIGDTLSLATRFSFLCF